MEFKALNEYRSLKAECRMWEKELEEMEKRTVKDTVRGSSKDFPFTAHPVTVEGVPETVSRRRKRLEKRKSNLAKELDEIEKWIDEIQDSQIRQIVNYVFLRGYSWKKTAILMHNTESAIKMRWKRFAEQKNMR